MLFLADTRIFLKKKLLSFYVCYDEIENLSFSVMSNECETSKNIFNNSEFFRFLPIVEMTNSLEDLWLTLSFVSSPERGRLFVVDLLLNQRASPP